MREEGASTRPDERDGDKGALGDTLPAAEPSATKPDTREDGDKGGTTTSARADVLGDTGRGGGTGETEGSATREVLGETKVRMPTDPEALGEARPGEGSACESGGPVDWRGEPPGVGKGRESATSGKERTGG